MRFWNKKNKKQNKEYDSSEKINIEYLIHELKTPIAVIETSLETLLRKKDKLGGLNERQERILNRAIRNAKKTREMIHSLLEVGRAKAEFFDYINFSPFDVLYEVLFCAVEVNDADLFDNASELKDKDAVIDFLSKNGIIFNIDSNLKDTFIYQDEAKFRYIIGNIVQNAFKYKKSFIKIESYIKKNYIYIKIQDDGSGIASKNHKIIFEPYKRSVGEKCNHRTHAGHGLGLSGALIMSKSLAGDIKLKSDKGKGALFQVILPVKGVNLSPERG
jgi:two-component system, OmpR family, sensor kinase